MDPLQDGTTTIPFTGGLTATNPVATTAGGTMQFDPVTGTMCFTPNGAQQAVVAVQVDEYRNGTGETGGPDECGTDCDCKNGCPSKGIIS